MAKLRNFLFELGTEELPPKALPRLGSALFDGVCKGLEQHGLTFDPGASRWYAAPRRLAVAIGSLAEGQPDRTELRLGPAVAAAFDAEGNPTRAAEGFAGSVGAEVSALQRLDTPKGERLAFEVEEKGRSTAELLPEILAQALDKLPIPKRMRWGNSEAQFVRPVHWLVMIHGDQVIDATLLDTNSGNQSRGHRFHHPEPVLISNADNYLPALEAAYVIADFDQRRKMVVEQVTAAAKGAEVVAQMDPALVDEVTALVEWPVALAGRFDDEFLGLPPEVLISTMQGHQKFFPCTAEEDLLAPVFVGVSNLQSKDPAQVIAGYERVIRPRLADAKFFWEQDLEVPLASHQPELAKMVFQKRLGTLWDKVERSKKLIGALADELGLNGSDALTAADLSKCDLLTQLVGEFPELQGCMGRHYAQHQGIAENVALAIEQHYWPRFSGDQIPTAGTGRLLALADRLDTLAGIFGVGQKPTGTKDPFGLRRAALGVLRIIVEGGLNVDLRKLIERAVHVVREHDSELEDATDEIYDYTMERARGYFAERGIGHDVFDSVASIEGSGKLLDFDQRAVALNEFRGLPEAASLAAANKRISNILRKADGVDASRVDSDLFEEKSERSLWDWLSAVRRGLGRALDQGDYADALNQLASLRDPVDRFFEDVLVMAEDDAVRANRIALLAAVRESFLGVADISHLQSESVADDPDKDRTSTD